VVEQTLLTIVLAPLLAAVIARPSRPRDRTRCNAHADDLLLSHLPFGLSLKVFWDSLHGTPVFDGPGLHLADQ